MIGLFFAIVIIAIAAIGLTGLFEGVDEMKGEIIRMADKDRQKALKRPLKRNLRYAVIGSAKKRV